MADKLAVGAVILFNKHACGDIFEGKITLISPSGNYVYLRTREGGQWVPVSTIGVLEVLQPAPPPSAEPAPLESAPRQQLQQQQPPEQPGITEKLDEIKADLIASMAGSEAPLPTTAQGVKLATN